MNKTFAFQVAIIVAALAVGNVACSRKGKSNNDDRVGAVGPADKPAPTLAEILDGTFKDLEPTFKSDRNSISHLIQAASVGKSMTDTSANGAIGAPIATFKVSLAVVGAEDVLDFAGDSTGITDLKSGKMITLTTKGQYDVSKLGESLTVRAKCLESCNRIAVLALSFKKEGYKMDSLPQTAGIIFTQKPGMGYVIERSLTDIKRLEPKVVQTAEAPIEFSSEL